MQLSWYNVVSCYTPVNEEFMRSFLAKKERNYAMLWDQSTRHGMVNNNWKKLASGMK